MSTIEGWEKELQEGKDGAIFSLFYNFYCYSLLNNDVLQN